MEKFSYIVKALKTQGKMPGKMPAKQSGGKQGLQLLPSKKNPNVKRWEQTQQKQAGQPGQNVQADIRVPVKKEPYWGKHSGAEVGHRVNYHGNHISITGVGEHGVTARDEHGRKYEIFHHELRKRGN
jgi:hypothetical protein